jgi:hypothetical protein
VSLRHSGSRDDRQDGEKNDTKHVTRHRVAAHGGTRLETPAARAARPYHRATYPALDAIRTTLLTSLKTLP